MDRNTITIGTLDASDWQKFKDIRLEALSSSSDAFESTFTDVVKEPDEMWQKLLTDPNWVFLFAKENDMIIGMVAGHVKHNEEESKAVINMMYVSQSHRGLGIGKKLVHQLLDELRTSHKIQVVKLCVFEHNEKAEALYRAAGFTETGRKDDAKETDTGFSDEILMERTL